MPTATPGMPVRFMASATMPSSAAVALSMAAWVKSGGTGTTGAFSSGVPASSAPAEAMERPRLAHQAMPRAVRRRAGDADKMFGAARTGMAVSEFCRTPTMPRARPPVTAPEREESGPHGRDEELQTSLRLTAMARQVDGTDRLH